MRAVLIAISLACFGASNCGAADKPVDRALASLRSRNDVAFTDRGGWIVVTEANGLTIWSFTPATHPANPAYVKRWLYQKGGAWYVGMQTQCGAPKSVCDALVAEFTLLNEQMRKSIEASHER